MNNFNSATLDADAGWLIPAAAAVATISPAVVLVLWVKDWIKGQIW